MINLTLISFSASSILSTSPLFTMHNYFVSNSNFKFFNPIIFYNINSITLQKGLFDHGLGPLINSDTPVHEYFDPNVPSIIDHTNEKCLCIIRDCIFKDIAMIESSFISIGNESSFYLTDCLFAACTTEKNPFIFISTRACKLGHICVFDVKGTGSDFGYKRNTLFIATDIPSNSFFKLVYSTFIGKDETDRSNVFEFKGQCALQIQCNNFSKWHSSTNDDTGKDRYIVSIIGPACLNWQMNTLFDMDSKQFILYLNTQDSNIQYKHYVGFTNFFNNKYGRFLICISMQANTQLHICDCVFKNNFDYSNNINRYINQEHNDLMFSVINCIFDDFMHLDNCKNPTIINSNINNAATSFEFAHFVTNTACVGDSIDAFACNNDTCPDGRGCSNDAFDFTSNQIKFTEKFHTRFNTPTPTPTQYFTESLKFSNSLLFSSSFYFSESKYFSFTDYFSKSSFFSSSYEFSKSDAFHETDPFTKSNYFTKSDVFHETDQFTKSNYFTKSDAFHETGRFSKSAYFTKSDAFHKTDQFSKSMLFSESNDFTKSNIFEPTMNFVHTKSFSLSLTFLNSIKFSESNAFSQSIKFSKSFYFSKTSDFTISGYFTYSTDFSSSDVFSTSFYFTKTGYFSESDIFHPSSQFQSTLYFSKSGYFSTSNVFSSSGYFNPTDYFSKTGVFSTSYSFSNSDYFHPTHHSNHFSASQSLNPKSPVNINIKQDETKTISTGAKAGIGAACAAVVGGLIALGVILIRRRKFQGIDIEEESIDIHDDIANSIVTQNPLTTFLDADDPFEDDFE